MKPVFSFHGSRDYQVATSCPHLAADECADLFAHIALIVVIVERVEKCIMAVHSPILAVFQCVALYVAEVRTRREVDEVLMVLRVVVA